MKLMVHGPCGQST